MHDSKYGVNLDPRQPLETDVADPLGQCTILQLELELEEGMHQSRMIDVKGDDTPSMSWIHRCGRDP